MRACSAMLFSLLTAGAALPAVAHSGDLSAGPVPTAKTIADLAGLADLPMGASTLVAVPVDNGKEILDLTRFTNLSPGARVVEVGVDGVERDLDMSGVVLLRGSIAGDPDSLAFLSVTGDQVSGFIRAHDGVRVISSGAAGRDGTIASALMSDLRLGDGNPSCSVDTGNPAFYPDRVVPEPSRIGPDTRGGAAPCRVARVAVDSDYEFTQLFGGNTSIAAAYAQTLLAASSTIYERDVNVRLMVPYLRVWAANNDPYAGSSGTTDFLFEMRDFWNLNMRHIPRETVHGLSGRGLGGGVAYLNALCNSQYAHGVSANINGSFPLPVQDNSHQNWDLMVVSHELGHNFGSGHTHDAYSPPIDGCGTGDCSAALDATIMSYCHTCPGGLSNMDMRFHSRVQARIHEFLDQAACDLTTVGSPVARDDYFEIIAGDPIDLDVLSNDAATSCDPVAMSITSVPATTGQGATVSVVSSSTGQFAQLRYTPAPGFSGQDTFTYTAGAAGSATVTVNATALRQPVTGVTTEPGIDVDYYALTNPGSMPDFDALTPYASDIVASINYPSTGGNFATSGRDDGVGAVYRALIEVPAAGWYQLSVESDDGSLMYLGGDLIIDNDGLHGMVDASAYVPLAAGKHDLRVEFFENGGGAGLIVRYFGANFQRQPVPASAWSRITGVDCPADLAEPFGALNFFDVAAYLALYNAGDPAADLAAPFGSLNFFDITHYLSTYNAGCP